MKRITDALLFSFLISMPMVMIDAIYHLGTETAVHVNYVIVKLTIIWLTSFLVAWWVGKGKNEGIFTCITGPILFYLYYLFADATINRARFKIDDSFGYIFLHIACFAITYAVVYNLMTKEKGNRELQIGGKAFIFSLLVIGLDAFYQMGKVQLQTHDEELVAAVLGFDTILYLLFSVMLVAFLLYYYMENLAIQIPIFLVLIPLIIHIIGVNLIRSGVGFFSGAIPYALIYYYMRHKNET